MAFSIEKKNTVPLVALLFLVHIFLSLRAATQLSPTWDEIAYPHSGYVQLTTGSLNYYPQNPFLARLLYGAPFFLIGAKKTTTDNPSADGFSFTYQQEWSPQTILLLGRFIPVVFSVFLGGLLYFWSRRAWGETGGLVTLVAYLVTPIFMSRASLALMEMPMFFFMGLSFWWHQEKPTLSAVAMGLALLCKLTALPALVVLMAVDLTYRRYKAAFLWGLGSIAIFMMGYFPWQGGIAAIRATLSDMLVFNRSVPYYFAGSNHAHSPGYLSLVAFLLKAPLFMVGLGLWGFFVGWQKKDKRMNLIPMLYLALAYILFGALVGAPVSTIQLSPIYLAVVFSCGALGAVLSKGVRQKKVLIVGLLVFSAVDVYRIYPNHLAYFNLIAGGPERGHFWLGDSDQDWGQSLPALGFFLKKNREAVIYLSYSGAGKPEAHGVDYIDFFSPSLASRAHIDAPMPSVSAKGPAYFILGTKVAQSYGSAFAWVLQNRKPKKLIGQTFFVYDISQDAEFFNWMGEFYGATNRGEKAAWCAAKAALLSPTDIASRK